LVAGQKYVPDRGDLIWLNFDPQAGREQSGRRPAMVVSPALYNRKSGLALVCPVTSKVKGYPFEVALPRGLPLKGVVLVDQVKSVDWKARKARLVKKIPSATTAEILAKLRTLG
jgi:mRNA interferase MazF